MQHLKRIGLLVGVALVLAGCAGGPSVGGRADEAMARRADAIRGAADVQWEAIREAHQSGRRLDSKYVFAIAEFRTGAIRAQTMALIGDSSDRAETNAWLDEAEKTLPKVVAAGAAMEARAEGSAEISRR